MPPRPSFLLTWQALLAGALGIVAGLAFARPDAGPLAPAAQEACVLVGAVFMGWMRALAVVSIVSGVVLGLVGLEPTRALKRLLGKTAVWIAGSSLLAVAVALWVALGLSTRFPAQEFIRPAGFGVLAHDGRLAATLGWGWLGLVGLSLGIGYYRNQIEEGTRAPAGSFLPGTGRNARPDVGTDASVDAGRAVRAGRRRNGFAGGV